MFEVLGYLCGLQTAICSYQSARHSQYAKIEESSTNFTLHDTVTTRAVTSDTIIPPRPQPPPPPRPALKAHHDYSHHNHNGARQTLPPVRSVSQHRLGSGQEMQDYYELRPRQPDTSLDHNYRHSKSDTEHLSNENGDNCERGEVGRTRVEDSDTAHQTRLHPGGDTPHSVPRQYSIKETGAIPKKKKKTVPLPSPLTVHPDEIIALPMEDLSPISVLPPRSPLTSLPTN